MDAVNLPLVSGLRWGAHRTPLTTYAIARRMRLHRVVMGVTDPAMQVDHIDGNGLRCTLDNLRATTTGENSQNVARRGRASLRNVTFSTSKGRFVVQARSAGISHYGGSFASVADAQEAARRLRQRIFTHANEDRHK